jgi:LMBR1 domain-containing protein 1
MPLPAGWILFLIFAGWGVLGAPIDWIYQYIGRPKAVITKSEFLERARGLAQRAKEIKVGGGGGGQGVW